MRRLFVVFLSLTMLTALPAMAQEVGSLVDAAADDGELTTLVAALDAAGLLESLASNGPYTILAPTDAAFDALLTSLNVSAEELFADTTLLTDLLMYHVVAGEVPSNQLATATLLAGLNEADITVAMVNGTIILNGTAQVLRVDIPARNGVIHVIDQVLIPALEVAPMPTLPPLAGSGYIRVAHLSSDMPAVDIYIDGVLRGAASLAPGQVSDWAALPAAAYAFTFVPQGAALNDAVFGPISVTVPDGSWSTVGVLGSTANETLRIALIDQEIDAPLAPDSARVTFFHAVEDAGPLDVWMSPDAVLFDDIGYGEYATLDVPAGDYDLRLRTSPTPEPLRVDIPVTLLEPGNFYFITALGPYLAPLYSIEVVTADEIAAVSAGMVTPTADVVDTAEMALPNTIDVLEADGRFSELLAAIELAGLTQQLRDAETVTIFAPTDAAFAALPSGMIGTLANNPEALANVLLYHVVMDDVTLPPQAAPLTALGVPLPFDSSGEVLVLNGGSRVLEVDLLAGNGRVHVIDAVLLPPTS